MTVVRYSRECLTTVVRHSCEPLTTVRHLPECRETFVRVSHNVCANFNQSYFSQLSLETVLFMLHNCRNVQIADTSLQCVCERLQRVGDGFATNAMTWRLFCDDFCGTKKYNMFKTLANHSGRVRNTCKDIAIPCKCFVTILDGLANRFANPS